MGPGSTARDKSELQDALTRLMTDPNSPNTIVPETGAGAYWYVDPRSQSQLPDQTDQAFNLDAVLRRLGPPQQQNISF